MINTRLFNKIYLSRSPGTTWRNLHSTNFWHPSL